MALCCQLLLLPRPAKSRYAVLPPLLDQRQWRRSSHGGLRWWQRYQQQWWQWRWQRCNSRPRCCRNPPPLHVSSLLASSFPFSLPTALSAGRHLPAFNAKWLMAVCSCLLPSLSLLSPAVQRSSMIVSPAASRQRISLILCCRQPAPAPSGLSAVTKPWRRTGWFSSASGSRCCLSGKVQWLPDKVVRRATHPAMRVVGPPAAAGQSCCMSSSALSLHCPPHCRRQCRCQHCSGHGRSRHHGDHLLSRAQLVRSKRVGRTVSSPPEPRVHPNQHIRSSSEPIDLVNRIPRPRVCL